MKVEGIDSEEELKKAQAAAQAQGSGVTNYNEWEQILKEFSENGIESTGSYEGDVAKMNEIRIAVQEYVQELQVQDVNTQNKPVNTEVDKVQEITKTDREQQIKATFASATSSVIMADYMKYYHLLF